MARLFNFSEKRLARVLLSLDHNGHDRKLDPMIPHINQQTLAEMIGTTRSRVSHFMNRFRKLGFVDYHGNGLTIHSDLLQSCRSSLAIEPPVIYTRRPTQFPPHELE